MLRRALQRFLGMTKLNESAAAAAAEGEEKLHKVVSGRVEKKEAGEGDAPSAAAPAVEGEKKPPRIKYARYAMLVGYQGKNYFGMQIQKDHPTIESHLLDALHKCGFITDENKTNPYSFFFQRAARTDKAVSAVRQICSLQLPRSDDYAVTGAAAMNNHLAEDIRVFGFRRATSNFHCQKACDARTYSYTLPTYAFAKPNELTTSSYRIRPEVITEINEILSIYKGTHNFYNYTSRKEHSDRSCHRYILSFECGTPFIYRDELRNEDVEFVTLVVKGQSFILHQIRKMVGMMITVVRELNLRSAIQRSFESQRMDVPKAPGLGLLLERLHYENYDRNFGNKSHEPMSNWGEEIEARIESMKLEHITKEIMETEIRTQSMMQWLADLATHDFSASADAEEPPKQSFVTMAVGQARAAEEAQAVEGEVKEEKMEQEQTSDGAAKEQEQTSDGAVKEEAKAEEAK